jgi:hypothetical protein
MHCRGQPWPIYPKPPCPTTTTTSTATPADLTRTPPPIPTHSTISTFSTTISFTLTSPTTTTSAPTSSPTCPTLCIDYVNDCGEMVGGQCIEHCPGSPLPPAPSIPPCTTTRTLKQGLGRRTEVVAETTPTLRARYV